MLSRHSWPSICLLLATVGLVSCCSYPRADKYFDRSFDAMDTLRMFQYAVETGQYGIAYECLTPSSRERVSPLKFEYAVRWGNLEELRDIPVWDLITQARAVYPPTDDRPPANSRRDAIYLRFDQDTGDPADLSVDQRFLFELVDEEWLIDLLETWRPLLESE